LDNFSGTGKRVTGSEARAVIWEHMRLKAEPKSYLSLWAQ
jgi:hypothetical protein